LEKRSVSGHRFSDAIKADHSEWLYATGLTRHGTVAYTYVLYLLLGGMPKQAAEKMIFELRAYPSG
jgi:hypothetical protein